MGRDSTARRRMAEKRSREKAAGLRRLNVALKPDLFDKISVLMNQYDCSSQAGLIERLIMGSLPGLPVNEALDDCNLVTNGMGGNKTHLSEIMRQPESFGTAKIRKRNSRICMEQKESVNKQMSLFDS